MVQAILAQVGDALGYAHRNGVVHRDIKPGNILIDDEGWAVVTDFGIAKVQESEGLTMTGVAVGTPTYMSPEQCTGGDVTGSSDQYSLGVVAYEMLAGRPPFVGSSMMALMYSHFHEPPPPLESFRPDCPPQMVAAVMRMLSKGAADRWPTIEEAANAMGARQLPRDDPTRSALITLARTGVTHRIVSQVQTPRSPIPLTRRNTVPTPAPALVAEPPRRNVALLAVAAVALLGAGYLIAQVINWGQAPIEAPVAAQSDSVSLSPRDSSTSAPAGVVSPPPATPPLQRGPEVGRGDAGTTRRVPEASLSAPDESTAGRRTQEQPSRPPTQPVGSAADSSVSRAESTAAPPVVTSPAVRGAELAQPPANVKSDPIPVPPVADAALAVRTAIQAFAASLGAADLAAARRLYPTMPTQQREGFEALFRDGGTMTPRWTISDVIVTGDVATARILGNNLVRTRRGPQQEVPVSLRARLERRDGEWRIISLVN
jgi:serine/threonine protein kinase